MKKNVFFILILLSLSLLFSCASHFTYIPPSDAEENSGHFLLFYNEVVAQESEDMVAYKPSAISVEITQEGKTILSDMVDAGEWNLYPIPEGVYLVSLEIDFLDKPLQLKRSFSSKTETVNALNVDFWRIEPVKMKSDIQTKKMTCSGDVVNYIMNSKREDKKLTFEDIQRISVGK